ncbi:Nicotinate phosphoribosyltransferase, variant 2 [Balamuthia mandrillaris]
MLCNIPLLISSVSLFCVLYLRACHYRAFPNSCLCLVDTYDTLKSGIPNFLCVAYALHKFGYKAVGELLLLHVFLRQVCFADDIAKVFVWILAILLISPSEQEQCSRKWVNAFMPTISASSPSLLATSSPKIPSTRSIIKVRSGILCFLLSSLFSFFSSTSNNEGHEVDVFGVGTHLVTCQKQPALGCVYKLVEINGIPRIKISQDLDKVTLPGKKDVYRLYGLNEIPVVDLIVEAETTSFDRCLHRHQQSQEASSSELQETVPTVGKRIMCHHPSDPQKRAYITPTKVVPLLELVWDCGRLKLSLPSLEEIKHRCQQQVAEMREDHLRPLNPTPYKVSLSSKLWNDFNALWQESVPISDITHISE